MTIKTKQKQFDFQKLLICVSVMLFIILAALYLSRGLKALAAGGRQNQLKAAVMQSDNVNDLGYGYVFQGKAEDNYLKYNGLIWRIIKADYDGKITIITDQPVNYLPFNGDCYSDSQIKKYLNEYFLNQLDSNMLSQGTYCDEKLDDLTNVADVTAKQAYVTLCDVRDYLNSFKDGKSYLNDGSQFYLANANADGIYYGHDEKLAVTASKQYRSIRPVVTLSGQFGTFSGTGTENDPYRIDSDDVVRIGSKIVLADGSGWTVIAVNDTKAKLMADKPVAEKPFGPLKQQFDPQSAVSIASWLNDEYYNSLPFKDAIIDGVYNTGAYENNIDDIVSQKVTCKVAMADMYDLKLSEADGYYLLNSDNRYIWVYGSSPELFKPTTEHDIVPVITISLDLFGKEGD